MEWYYVIIAFGTLGTFGTGLWYYVIRPYLQGQEEKRNLEKAIKSELREDYKNVKRRIEVEIEQTLDFTFHGNTWSNFPDSISPEIRNDLEDFSDKLWECRVWWYAGKQTIRLAIWYSIAQHLPQTFVNYPEMWEDFSRVLTHPILEGKEVRKSWLEEKEIMIHKRLRDKFDREDGSEAINEFFRLLNNKLDHKTQHQEVLQALKAKIEELKRFGEKTINKIEQQISEIENRIDWLEKITS